MKRIKEIGDRALIASSLVIGLVLNLYLPLLDILVTIVELVLIGLIIKNLDMKKYKEIYNKMDSLEQRLVHKLLSLLAACIVAPIVFLLIDVAKVLINMISK